METCSLTAIGCNRVRVGEMYCAHHAHLEIVPGEFGPGWREFQALQKQAANA